MLCDEPDYQAIAQNLIDYDAKMERTYRPGVPEAIAAARQLDKAHGPSHRNDRRERQ